MSTNRVIFVIGLLILAVPITGFPRVWEEWFLVVAGLVLILLSSLNIWQRSIVNRLKFHSRKKIDREDQGSQEHQSSHNEEISTDHTYSQE